jgi:hypothetical protein
MDDLQTSGVDAGTDSTSTALATTSTDFVPQSDTSLDQTTTAPPSPEETAAPEWLGIANQVDQWPTDDSDLAAQTYPHAQGLRDQRQQIRTLTRALKEQSQGSQDYAAYQQLGSPETLQAAVAISELLYSPLTDGQGNPVFDPKTQTPYITTAPFLQHLDEVSPGMPEQLLTDLLAFQPMDEQGRATAPLYEQVLNYWDQRNPGWWRQRYGVSATPTYTRTVSAQELADIPTEYHEAYKQLPPSVRNAWAAYEEEDQALMLHREKENLERNVRDQQRQQEDEQRAERERQQYLVYLRQQQDGYFGQVRRERFSVIANQLAQQVTFSADPATDTVMRGSVLTLMSNLLDPDWRFVSEDALKAMGIQLGQQFDAALNTFNLNANNRVAYELAGDKGQAMKAEEKANDAANFLTTKLGVIALAAAKKMGAQQKAAAATQAAAVAGATTGLPNAGMGTSPNGQQAGILPPGMMPGSPEAVRWLAQATGFLRN